MTLPLGTANLKLAGRARWVRHVGEDENGLCLVGMQFEEQDETTARILESLPSIPPRERTIQRASSPGHRRIGEIKPVCYLGPIEEGRLVRINSIRSKQA